MYETTLVLTTVPGRESLLQRAWDSALHQTLPFAEVMVMRDEERKGPAWNRNRAVHEVETEYVAFLDDDDWLLPNHNEVLTGALDAGPVKSAVAYGRNRTWSGSWVIDPADALRDEPWAKVHRLILRRNFIPVTVVARTSALQGPGATNCFPTGKIAEDWLLWLELLHRGWKFIATRTVTWVQDVSVPSTTGGSGRPATTG